MFEADAQSQEILLAAAVFLLFALLTAARVDTAVLDFFKPRTWIAHWLGDREITDIVHLQKDNNPPLGHVDVHNGFQRDKIPPPVESCAQVLPFSELSQQNFERLCLTLAGAEW